MSSKTEPRDEAAATMPGHLPGPYAPRPDLPVSIEAEHADRINFAMQQNGAPVVNEVSITNTGEDPLRDVAVTVSLENEESDPWTAHIARIDPGSTYRLEPMGLSFRTQQLATRTEAERTHLLVSVTCEAGERSRRFNVDLLAFDQWPGIGHWPEMTAAFVTPNHARIAELLRSAREALGAISDRDALDGYQSGSRQRAAQIAEACFNAVATRNLGYINPPASFEVQGQRVRLVDRLCREGLATCLDLSLLLASMWEQCGLHPVILLPEGHAMPAIWTHEAHLPEPAIDEPARIRNLIELGEIVPVESTLLTHRGATFAAAVDAAKAKMHTPGSLFCAIDIRTCRKRGVRPLPLRDGGDVSAVDLSALQQEAQPAAANTTLDRITLAERAERQSTGDAKTDDEAETGGRIERWQTRLLDLSLRNRLINFRQSARTVEFSVPDVAAVEDALAAGDTFTIHPRTDGDEAFLREQIAGCQLHATEASAEMQKRLLTLYRTAKASIEETGANLLHLSMGMLKWYESDSSEAPRYAPIILLPIQLQRISSGSGYRYEVSLSEEPLRPNVTLLEKLRTEFGIATDELHGLPEDETGLDVPLILRNFRKAIRESKRWEVEESVFIGLFSFNKFLMWRDLRENLDRLKQNSLVAHLVDGGSSDFDSEPFPRPEQLDQTVKPGELFCTRDADSTQLAAVRAAALEKTFVLEGPPGTGKSQTIANIVADSLGRGKRVLFVAEKMAALSVVRHRLEEDGLAPFCLELHSAKASKKEVLAQLDSALTAADAGPPPNWEQMCEQLRITRAQLNAYVDELHEERPSGETLYRVLGRLSLLGEGPRIDLPKMNVAATTKQQLDTWRTAIDGLLERSGAIDPPHEHALRGIGRAKWQFDLPAEAKQAIDAADEAIVALGDSLQAFGEAAQMQLPIDALSRTGMRAVVTMINHLRQMTEPIPDPALLTGGNSDALHQQVREAIALGRQRDEQRAVLLGRYREEFLQIDHLLYLDPLTRAKDQFAPLRMLSEFLTRRKLRPYATGGTVPVAATLHANLETAREVKRSTAALAGMSGLAQVLGGHWNNGQADWAAVERLLESAAAFRKAAAAVSQDKSAAALLPGFVEIACSGQRLNSAKPVSAQVVKAWNNWGQAWESLKTTLVTSSESFDDADHAWFTAVRDTFARWITGLADLDQWCNWRAARNTASDAGLDDLINRYENGQLQRDDLHSAFGRSYGEQWFNTTANQIEAIRGFNADSHQATIQRFREIDKAVIAHTRHAVAARLAEATPTPAAQGSSKSELGILRRELEKKRRHMPTRKLIETIPNLLARLKPCFLMSPLSVAQYLDAKLPPFDLVVFDEASQIPVWDSIGAIARGKSVVVVGDSKQLPPTSFFDAVDGDDEAGAEDVAVEDMESILKECNASGVPAMRLRWHYRSRHESLIAFSNHHYYDNSLHTFPSPQERSADLGVTFRHVPDGVYDRGGSRTNRVEAAAVVQEVVHLLQSAESSDSIGIVTFNQAQQVLIEDLLDAARREHADIERFFTKEVGEPVFVKNLENVQGDERDTIIFSVGYGPDQAGKPSMNFGPLNKEGGERRLNVAVTRARRRLLVFSSLRADQIDLRRTQALGVKHFKTFLDYADRGPQAIADAVDYNGSREFESGFEKAVCNALTGRGWEIDTQVGCAGYRVDLAVRDTMRPGRYLLGIECDGASYHSARTARDRDRLRQAVLENLGWRMERVWSTEWRISPERCLKRVEQAIEQAQREAEASPELKLAAGADAPRVEAAEWQPALEADADAAAVAVAVAPGDSPAPASQGGGEGEGSGEGSSEGESPLYAAAPVAPAAPLAPAPQASRVPALPVYALASPHNASLAKMDIFDGRAMRSVVTALSRVVETEGPIVTELARRRLADWFGQRMTERYRGRFDEVLAAAMAAKPIREEAGVLWPADMHEADFDLVRVPGDDPATRRDLDQIPLAERVNAVVHVLETQFGLPQEDLQREVAKLFGTQRVTARLAEVVAEAIDTTVATGRIQRDNGHVTLKV